MRWCTIHSNKDDLQVFQAFVPVLQQWEQALSPLPATIVDIRWPPKRHPSGHPTETTEELMSDPARWDLHVVSSLSIEAISRSIGDATQALPSPLSVISS